jgi:hypothetical protein
MRVEEFDGKAKLKTMATAPISTASHLPKEAPNRLCLWFSD